MQEKELEKMHLKCFLENRKIPETTIEAVFSTPFVPEMLIDAMLDIYAHGEHIGANHINPYLEKDKDGTRLCFFSYITPSPTAETPQNTGGSQGEGVGE